MFENVFEKAAAEAVSAPPPAGGEATLPEQPSHIEKRGNEDGLFRLKDLAEKAGMEGRPEHVGSGEQVAGRAGSESVIAAMGAKGVAESRAIANINKLGA